MMTTACSEENCRDSLVFGLFILSPQTSDATGTTQDPSHINFFVIDSEG